MRRLTLRGSVPVCGAMALSSCFLGPDVDHCQLYANWGIAVEVRDSVSMELAVFGAVLEIVEGSYRETVRGEFPSQIELLRATERPGIYDLVVSKPGYVDWVATDVVVREVVCHVRTVRLRALLRPI